jgi:hypothetical protein
MTIRETTNLVGCSDPFRGQRNATTLVCLVQSQALQTAEQCGNIPGFLSGAVHLVLL